MNSETFSLIVLLGWLAPMLICWAIILWAYNWPTKGFSTNQRAKDAAVLSVIPILGLILAATFLLTFVCYFFLSLLNSIGKSKQQS